MERHSVIMVLLYCATSAHIFVLCESSTISTLPICGGDTKVVALKKKLHVAYTDGMRLLLKVSRWSSASHLFVQVDDPSCLAVLRNLRPKNFFSLVSGFRPTLSIYV